MFRPYFSLGFQYSLFIVAPRLAGIAAEKAGLTRGVLARAETRDSVCERALGQFGLILTPSLIQSEFTEETARGRMRTNYVI